MNFFVQHKKKFTNGFISLFFIALGAWAKSLFDSKKAEAPISIQQQTQSNVAKDSATQINPQIKQEVGKDGNGTVEVYHTKTVNNYPAKPSGSGKKVDTPMVNNGIMNIGGTGNTYYQTVQQGNPQRHLDENVTRWLRAHINKKDAVFQISSYSKEENIAFAKEITNFLISQNIKVRSEDPSIIFGGAPSEKFNQIEAEYSDDSSSAIITVYPMK